MLTVRIQLAWRWTIVGVAAGMVGGYLLGTGRPVLGQVLTTEPTATTGGDATTMPVTRTSEEVMNDLHADGKLLGQTIGDMKALGDEATRKAVAPKAIPILKKMDAEFDEMARLVPDSKADIQPAQDQFLAFSSILGDADATAKLAAMAASKDQAISLRGQGAQLLARWLAAGKDATAQGKIADDLEKLDKAHTDNIPLTSLTAMFSESATSPELKARLESLITDTMNNDAAAQMKEQIAAEQKIKSIENKPLVITGKQADGKDFTTADWKGKVVLVDFWATTCEQCVVDLPKVKKMYADYHDKGLEIVGVSNDINVKELKDYVAKNEMPWPQLFDVTAAGQQQWNPITTGFGITTIPTMFIIDKKGTLRTVDADENMGEMIPKLLAE